MNSTIAFITLFTTLVSVFVRAAEPATSDDHMDW